MRLFHEGEFKSDANVRDAERILALMRDPTKSAPVPEEEKPWSSVPSEVIHLNTDTFKQELKKKRHALVMFYAPCKYKSHLEREVRISEAKCTHTAFFFQGVVIVKL